MLHYKHMMQLTVDADLLYVYEKVYKYIPG